MRVLRKNIVYDNPIPQLRSRQAAFPWLCKLNNGDIAAVFGIGEAFESADHASYISYSNDNGNTWSVPHKMYDKPFCEKPYSEGSKAVKLPDGRLMSIGYGFVREDADKPVGNPQTGGLLNDFVFYSESCDDGKTWSALNEIKCLWGPHVEASAPLTVLSDGTLITPITGFPDWDGNMTGELCGRALRSENGGKTWNDDAICMNFEGNNVLCYEQRMCVLDSGTIVCIAWNENVKTGERMANHYSYSSDNGKTWSIPRSTEIFGQASSLCSIGDERLLAIHAVRRDTDRPGIYAYVVDFSKKEWEIIDECLVWEPDTPVVRNEKMAEVFAYLKFGQPGAIVLDNGNVLMSHWFAEQGQYKVCVSEIKLD